MIGVWKDLGDDHLWQFQWRSDCIEGIKLDLVTPKWLAQTWRSHSLSSKGLVTVDLIDHHLCWLKTYAVEENLLVMSPNKHAEDACVVALGGHASVGPPTTLVAFTNPPSTHRSKAGYHSAHVCPHVEADYLAP